MGWTVDALWAAPRVSLGFPHIWSEAQVPRGNPGATAGCAAILQEFCDGSVGYFALEAPPWQEAGEVTGRALGSRQFHVGPLASADCSAGIPDGDALYLVRSRFQSLRGGVNDVGFHPLPIGDAARFLKPGHRLVVATNGPRQNQSFSVRRCAAVG